MKNTKKNILLVSGGNDSLYIYHKYNDKKQFECIYFDYGQEFIDNELEALDKNKIKYKIVKLPKLEKLESGFFKGRNLLFILKLSETFDDATIFIGTNKDDIFKDNSRRFFSKLIYCINNSYDKSLKIRLPLKKITKKEIIDYIRENNLKTYSCYEKDGPCGKCKACLEVKI